MTEKRHKKMNFIENSRNNRIFCDAFICIISVEILLSGEIDFNLLVPSYSKYNYEVPNGRHGGWNHVRASDKINKKEQEYIAQVVKEGFERQFDNIFQLRDFLTEKFNIGDDYLHPINATDNLSYTFKIAKKKRLEQGNKTYNNANSAERAKQCETQSLEL